jgi:hypothetical protein
MQSRVYRLRAVFADRVRPRSPHQRVVVAAFALTALALASPSLPSSAGATPGQLRQAAAPPTGQPNFGPNVIVFDPSMPTSEIETRVEAIAKEQVSNQFGRQRYALLFRPGSYGTHQHPLVFQVGYYTEVAGLGSSPRDVTINGHVDVYNQCLPAARGASDCTALINFWRSLSNLTINVAGADGCRASAEFWAVSQAAPMRRVRITGGTLSLMDYCTAGPQYASGGFIADTVAGAVTNGSQQQFLTRNSSIGRWSNAVWNQVFAGVQGAPSQSFPQPPYTTLNRNPWSREKPYLYLDNSGTYRVFDPAARRDSRGTSWQTGPAAGRSIPINNFFVARPTDRVSTINSQLARGKQLILTPGVYDIDRTIQVERAGTVVLGLGFATLTARKGVVPMSVAGVPGVDIAGLIFDAGRVTSPVLLRVGPRAGRHSHGHVRKNPDDPTALQDVFFRIGGPHVGRANLSLEVNSNDVILDDIWAWRADHGRGVGWTANTADTGVVVNGGDVTATGLFVEHYQKYQVIWRGEGGRTVMFQNEMPYDVPDQAAWRHGDVLGYAAYKVADSVRNHQAWGLGSYIYTNVDPTLHASQAFEVPVTADVRMHDLLTISLNRAGTVDHVVDGAGGPVTPTHLGPSTVVTYS